MAEVSGIYDSDPIQPVCKIGQKLGIWTQATWEYYKVMFIEPIPRSSQGTIDFGAVAANAAIARAVSAVIQIDEDQMFHLRCEPIDDVEVIIWEQAGQAKFAARGIHARVDRRTYLRDPYLATTTIFIIGENRDAQIEIRNPTALAQPVSRVVFWGYKYMLNEIDVSHVPALERVPDAVEKYLGPVCFLPAEGRFA